MVADISLLACSSFRKDPPRASDKEGRFLTSLALPEAADEDNHLLAVHPLLLPLSLNLTGHA